MIANETGVASTGDHTYSHMLMFFANGRKHLIFVQDGQNIVFYNTRSRKEQIHVLEMSPGIQKIERYSAYVMVQYSNSVEHVLFEQHEVLDTISKISLNNEIVSI